MREPGNFGIHITRSQAAKKEGIFERRLYQIMRLLRLDPKKQADILALQPSLGRGPLTEQRFRQKNI